MIFTDNVKILKNYVFNYIYFFTFLFHVASTTFVSMMHILKEIHNAYENEKIINSYKYFNNIDFSKAVLLKDLWGSKFVQATATC